MVLENWTVIESGPARVSVCEERRKLQLSGPVWLPSQLSFLCASFTFVGQMKSAEMGHRCSQSVEDARGAAATRLREEQNGGMNATVT